MKKQLLFLAAITIGHANAQSTDSAPYCEAIYNGGFIDVPHAITSVEMGTLINNSGPTQYVTPHYVYYNNITAPSIMQGNSINLAINHDDGTTIHGLAAWIDFNQDNDFDDAGEKVGETLWPGDDDPNTGTGVTYLVSVPSDAVVGTTRMRIRVYEDDNYTFSRTDLPVLPCKYNTTMNYDWGETEDYNVNILAASTGGIDELSNDLRIIKTEDKLTISNGLKIREMTIVNLQGMIVSTSVSSESIEISHVISGVYLLQITDENGQIVTKKIII